MFKKGEKIIYPRYGTGKIVAIYQEKINETFDDYYQIELFHSQISISVPVSEAEVLGLKYPMTKKELKTALDKVDRQRKIPEEAIEDIDTYCKTKLSTGDILDTIEVYNVLCLIAKKKEKLNKKLSFTESKYLERAIQFINSNIETILNKGEIKKYALEI